MTYRAPMPPRLPRIPGRPRVVGLVIAVVVVVIVLVGVFDGIYTSLLWYRSVGFSRVYTTRLWTEVLLFFVFGLAVSAVVTANIVTAYRLRPAFPALSVEQQALDRYRAVLHPRRVLALSVVAVLVAVAEGASAAHRWRTWLLWLNGTSFHVRDPQFHRDVSYYAFTYPLQRLVLGTVMVAVVLALLGAAATHYLYGGLRIQTPGEKVTAAARAHLSVLLGVFVLLKAVAYWLDRYGLAFSPRGVVTGPSYTDVNAVLPAKTILVFVAVICALLFFANVRSRNWTLPAVAFGLMVLSAVIIGGVYPWVVQTFTVRPNEAAREAPYIARMIAATRQAYALDHVVVSQYSAGATVSPATIASDTATIPNIRLLDPNVLQPTYQQLQQIRAYYGFPPSLDIDRYTVGGHRQDYVVAAREVDQTGLQPAQQNWINEHLVYTHGYGFVAAPANVTDPNGKPVFAEQNIPPVGPLTIDQPRVYYGELAPSYSIVDTTQQELDRPTDVGSGQTNTVYNGGHGVGVGGLVRRLLYALKFRDKNILFSSAITGRSQILYVRNPRDRAQQVAPYLQFDSDPYPAVVGGRVLWILDGYTTTNGYPYSAQRQLGSVASDATSVFGNRQPGQAGINYIRNSVKATVDAYDGTVHLYTWDASDPVLRTWKRIFPGTVLPHSAIPADLYPHLRYPEDLFKVQRDLLSSFHVSDPRAFYSQQDFWAVPDDPTQPGTGDQPPYYLMMQVPGQSTPEFNLTSALVFRGRANLAAFVSVSSDAPDYGVIRVLQLPRSTQVNGPVQAVAGFQAYAPFSKDQSLLDSGGSRVILGNLLTLPVQGALIYVDPVYVESRNQTTTYPLLQKVLVSYGNQIGYAGTLAEALNQVFGQGAGASSTTPNGTPSVAPPGKTQLSPALLSAISAAEAAYRDAEAALAAHPPDFAAYGAAEQRLGAALAQVARLSAAEAKAAGSKAPVRR